MRAREELKWSHSTPIRTSVLPDGMCMHIPGHDVPYKGIPTVDAVEAANQVKNLIKSLKISKISSEGWHIMEPHLLSENQMTAFTRECEKFIYAFSKNGTLAQTIAHVFEYDGAYRFRVQDLLSETTKEALTERPYRETLRLLHLNYERDGEVNRRKIGKYGRVAALLLLLPSIRRRFREALLWCDFSALQFDDNDRYWACIKEDYNYFGKTYEERQALLSQSKAPIR